MKERPILFSGEMVRAILDGRKTQTRRVVKPQLGDLFDYETCSPKPSCPYGAPGDRLWVRETFSLLGGQAEYRATRRMGEPAAPWRPSIFMPRWPSRIDLELTAVRVERVQDISEADAIAEGVKFYDDPNTSAVKLFIALWDSINAKRRDPRSGQILPYSWADNPRVWSLTFRRIRP